MSTGILTESPKPFYFFQYLLIFLYELKTIKNDNILCSVDDSLKEFRTMTVIIIFEMLKHFKYLPTYGFLNIIKMFTKVNLRRSIYEEYFFHLYYSITNAESEPHSLKC